MKKKIKELGAKILLIKTFIDTEFKKNKSLGFFKFLKTAKNGFYSISPLLYSMNYDNKHEYISDWTRLSKANRINDKKKIIFDNKFVFHLMNENNPSVLPIVTVTYSNKLYKYYNKKLELFKDIQDFSGYVSTFTNGLIIKPHTGGGGARISKVSVENGELKFTGDCKTVEEFNKKILNNKSTDFLFTENIRQTGILSNIFPDSLNSIRILTMIDPQTNKPFIARTIQRFGSKKSGLVDNLSAGGITALVDIEAGVLGKGVAYPYDGRMNWIEKHPDTGVRFTGLKVDNWEKIKEQILSLSEDFYYLPYIGWDIAPMEDGFIILEANSNSNTRILQIHGGLLKEPRVREFYRYYGVIK